MGISAALSHVCHIGICGSTRDAELVLVRTRRRARGWQRRCARLVSHNDLAALILERVDKVFAILFDRRGFCAKGDSILNKKLQVTEMSRFKAFPENATGLRVPL